MHSLFNRIMHGCFILHNVVFFLLKHWTCWKGQGLHWGICDIDLLMPLLYNLFIRKLQYLVLGCFAYHTYSFGKSRVFLMNEFCEKQYQLHVNKVYASSDPKVSQNDSFSIFSIKVTLKVKDSILLAHRCFEWLLKWSMHVIMLNVLAQTVKLKLAKPLYLILMVWFQVDFFFVK